MPVFVRWAFAVAGLLFALVLLADGCGRTAPTSAIDVPALQRELARVMHDQYLAQGFDYTPTVTCTASGSLTFNCVGAIQTTDRGVISQPETVTCTPAGTETGQRCSTGSGFALQ